MNKVDHGPNTSVFDQRSWRRLDELTLDRKEAHLFKRVFSPACLPNLARSVERTALRVLESSNYGKTDARARVYINETRRDDIVQSLLSDDAKDGECFPSFVQRVSKSKRFSLVMNNLEQASDELASRFGGVLSPFFEQLGVPLGGVEQALFCGNYTTTAFGIHEGFEHALLCHLGPNTKLFHCWSQSEYLQVSGTREPTFSSTNEYSTLLERSKLFQLEPGDVLFLPALVYHVGMQNDYSISVALPLYSYPTSRFLANLVLPTVFSKTLPFDSEGSSEHVPYEDSRHLLHRVKSEFESALQVWENGAIDRVVTDYWNRLSSNGYWELPTTILKNLDIDFATVDSTYSNTATRGHYKLVPPYKFVVGQPKLMGRSRGRYLYIKAQRLHIDLDDIDLLRFAEDLNSGRPAKPRVPSEAVLLREVTGTGGVIASEKPEG